MGTSNRRMRLAGMHNQGETRLGVGMNWTTVPGAAELPSPSLAVFSTADHPRSLPEDHRYRRI